MNDFHIILMPMFATCKLLLRWECKHSHTTIALLPKLLGGWITLMLSTRNGTCTSYVLFCFVSVERVTYRKLKRKALVLEYLQKVKVVEGISPIQKVALFNWFVVCLVWDFPCMSSTFTLTKLQAGYIKNYL